MDLPVDCRRDSLRASAQLAAQQGLRVMSWDGNFFTTMRVFWKRPMY